MLSEKLKLNPSGYDWLAETGRSPATVSANGPKKPARFTILPPWTVYQNSPDESRKKSEEKFSREGHEEGIRQKAIGNRKKAPFGQVKKVSQEEHKEKSGWANTRFAPTKSSRAAVGIRPVFVFIRGFESAGKVCPYSLISFLCAPSCSSWLIIKNYHQQYALLNLPVFFGFEIGKNDSFLTKTYLKQSMQGREAGYIYPPASRRLYSSWFHTFHCETSLIGNEFKLTTTNVKGFNCSQTPLQKTKRGRRPAGFVDFTAGAGSFSSNQEKK
jgi:hypothetical protein